MKSKSLQIQGESLTYTYQNGEDMSLLHSLINLQYSYIKQFSFCIAFVQEFSQQDCNYLALSLQSFKFLQNLHINIPSNCNIGILGAIELSQGFQFCQKLKYLKIDIGYQTQIGQEVICYLGEGIGSIQNLDQLSLQIGQNEIKGGFKLFGEQIGNCKSLTKLFLTVDSNQLQSEGVEGISSILKGCTNLKIVSIKLFSNEIKKEGALAISLGLSYCQNLEKLTLMIGEDNMIESTGLEYLGDGLKQCNKLQLLKLFIMPYNMLGYKGFMNFSKSLQKCKELKIFEFKYQKQNNQNQILIKTCTKTINSITASEVKELTFSLFKVKKLAKININKDERFY